MTNKLVKLGSLKGPKGDPGFNIRGEINAISDLDNFMSPDYPNRPKINDAWVLNPAYDDSELSIEEKKGAVWVYRGEDYEYQEGAIASPPFEYVTNLRGPKGDVSQNIHFAATYDDFVTIDYYNETMKIGDAVIDNGEADFTRMGNMYKIIDISPSEDTTPQIQGKWIEATDLNQIKQNSPVIVVSINSEGQYFAMEKEADSSYEEMNENCVFLDPGLWNVYGAKFAIYYFNKDNSLNNGVENKFEFLVKVDGSDIYYTNLEEGWTNCIFVRLHPDCVEPCWNHKWNQTADLSIPASLLDSNMLTITGWGEYENGWGKYTQETSSTRNINAVNITEHISHCEDGKLCIETTRNISDLSIFFLRYLDTSTRKFSFYDTSYSNNASVYCNKAESSSNVRIGPGDENNEFIFDSNGYFKNTDTDKWIGVYKKQDWRCYTTDPITNNRSEIKGQSFKVFEFIPGNLLVPSNPKVTIDTNNIISINSVKPNIYYGGKNIEIVDQTTINSVGYTWNDEKKSFAAGENINTATGYYSFAEGDATEAIGDYSHAEGTGSKAKGHRSHAEGNGTIAEGVCSHSEGSGVEAVGVASHAEGSSSYAEGPSSHAEGAGSHAEGPSSHAEGYLTHAQGTNSHTEGEYTETFGIASHAEGYKTTAFGKASHSEGNGVEAVGVASHAEGWHDIDSANSATYIVKQDEVDNTKYYIVSDFRGVTSESGEILYLKHGMTFLCDDEYYCVTEVFYDETNPDNPTSFRLNQSVGRTDTNNFGIELVLGKSIGECSHIEGCNTVAYGDESHAEGNTTRAAGDYSHTEGVETNAIGAGSHAEGRSSISIGDYSHAEGNNTRALGIYSHTEGINNTANGYAAHAEGARNKTTNDFEHAQGYFNVSNTGSKIENQTISSIGIGHYTGGTESPYNEELAIRKNALEVMRNGDIYIKGIGDYDGTNAVNKNTEEKTGKSLQKVVEELSNYKIATTDELGIIKVGENLTITEDGKLSASKCPNTSHSLIYSLDDKHIGLPLMYTGGFVVDDKSEMDVCMGSLDNLMSNVLSSWTPYGSNDDDKYRWGYCDSKTDISTTDSNMCNVPLVGVDENGEKLKQDVPIFNLNGKPQDYIFNTINTSSNTGYISPKKYENYDNIITCGILPNLHVGSSQDYLAVILGLNATNNAEITKTNISSTTNIVGMSLHAQNIHTIDPALPFTGTLDGRTSYGLYDFNSQNKNQYTASNKTTLQLIVWNTQNNTLNTRVSGHCNIPIISYFEGTDIIPFDDNLNNYIGTKNTNNNVSCIKTRLQRTGNIIKIWSSLPTKVMNDDNNGFRNDNDIKILYDRGITIDLENYILTYTDKNGSIFTKDFKKKETDEDAPVWKSGEDENGNPINKTYTQNQITAIRGIFDGLKGSAHFGYEAESNPGTFYRNSSEVPDKILRTYDDTVWELTGDTYTRITDTTALNEIQSGSRLAFNKVTGKLFYNEGTKIYQIASISEGSSGNSSSDSGSNSGSDSGSNSSQTFTLEPAKGDTLGGIMVGSNLDITDKGVLTAKGYEWNSSTNTMTITSKEGYPGKIHAAGGFFETSDARKKDIQGELPLDKAYDFIRNCEPILYNLKGSDKTQIGLIAQEVKEFFPEIVNEDSEGYLSLDYAKLTVIMLRVLKDLIDKK